MKDLKVVYAMIRKSWSMENCLLITLMRWMYIMFFNWFRQWHVSEHWLEVSCQPEYIGLV